MQVTVFFKDIKMNLNKITNPGQPAYPHEVSTKSYVDYSTSKIPHSYKLIHRLTSFFWWNKKIGCLVTASSQFSNRYTADDVHIFNGFYSEGWVGDTRWKQHWIVDSDSSPWPRQSVESWYTRCNQNIQLETGRIYTSVLLSLALVLCLEMSSRTNFESLALALALSKSPSPWPTRSLALQDLWFFWD